MQFYEDLEWQIKPFFHYDRCSACKNSMTVDEQIEGHMIEEGWHTICLGCYDKFAEYGNYE